MLSDVLINLGAALGGAAAGGAGLQLARRNQEGSASYVRLSAEDSDRIEKLEALIERLVALEQTTHEMLGALHAEVSSVRRDLAWQRGLRERAARGRAGAGGGVGGWAVAALEGLALA